MKHYGLLGEKLSHSYSSIIHNYVFEAMHIEADYQLLECKEEELPLYILRLRQKEFHGFNVTIPYKKKIIEYIDILDAKAKRIGSVNTVYLKDGKVIGTNTDYDGFLETLKAYDISVSRKDCYILGTGGASLAIFQVLRDLGGNCYFVSRTPKDSILGYPDLETRTIDLLINTTPVGMYPNIDKSPVSKDIAKRAKVGIDIIFNPRQTKFLQDANSSINGLYMLIMQAIKAEEIWQNQSIELNIDKLIQYLNITETFPDEIQAFIKNLRFKKEAFGRSEDEVYSFENRYILKISSDSYRLMREKERIDWLQNKIPGPQSIFYQEYNSKFYYLRTCIPGDTLIAERFLKNPKLLIDTLQSVISVLRSLDGYECPLLSTDSRGKDFVHGDLCLPNIIINDRNELIGFIDLDNAGLGDRWYDYAWLLWSFAYNLKTLKWNKALLEALNISFDTQKYKKYIPRENRELLEKTLEEHNSELLDLYCNKNVD